MKKSTGLEDECGKTWEENAEAQKDHEEIIIPYQFFEKELGFNTIYFDYARNLVRFAQETAKPNEERLKEFRDSNLASLTRELLSTALVSTDFERIKFADSLA